MIPLFPTAACVTFGPIPSRTPRGKLTVKSDGGCTGDDCVFLGLFTLVPDWQCKEPYGTGAGRMLLPVPLVVGARAPRRRWMTTKLSCFDWSLRFSKLLPNIYTPKYMCSFQKKAVTLTPRSLKSLYFARSTLLVA